LTSSIVTVVDPMRRVLADDSPLYGRRGRAGSEDAFQVLDQSKIAPYLERLAHDTKIYAQAALAGDRMFFHRLKAFRSSQSNAYQLQRVRAEANRA
jgi:hypothetical protein